MAVTEAHVFLPDMKEKHVKASFMEVDWLVLKEAMCTRYQNNKKKQYIR